MKVLHSSHARGTWQVARWMVVGAALPLWWACNARTLAPPDSRPSRATTTDFPASLSRQADILFMIDNSNSMAPLQTKLLDQFTVFMDRLKMIPAADGSGPALPDVHIAVISSDTGPGEFTAAGGCVLDGDQGLFQFRPRGSCGVSPLHTSPTQQTFLAASMNQTIRNYDGDISDAFKCIAALGDQGCGFEGQLKSVRWALDGSNAANQGFLRADALLAVILITNEDDCSLPDSSDLVDPSQNAISDPLGPLASFRCNEFGHLCLIDGKLQPPPRGVTTNLEGCVSNDTASGKLTKVADEVAFLKQLKRDPRQIFVAAITGPATPYRVEMDPAPGNGGALIPTVAHSCMQSTGEYGDPAVRIQQWVSAFGDHGLLEPICADTFRPALDAIATAIETALDPQCIDGTLVDEDPGTTALDPDCQVVDRYIDGQSQVVETALHACARDATLPCWALADDTTKCSKGKLVQVTRGADPLPDGLRTSISCSTCIEGTAQAGCPCVTGKEVPGCLP